ncbi:hypothetical protein [Hymenobacter cheonanensis]|uniref:hypothetical protein n=1 Tax=Hymenobacter sp. CA2-7 TaxID=3063993 RepID=UPI00272CEFC0|nr:hypothetical protein [Hymenobacter sp. CA2-7]
MQLIIRPSLPGLLGGFFVLSFLLMVSLVISPPPVSHVVLGIASLFGLLFLTDAWLSIRRAERHFQTALALKKLGN